jgi:hypothetical protein
MNPKDSRRTEMPRERSSLRLVVLAVGLLGAGMFIGSEVAKPPAAWGEVVTAVPPQHFQSGGQLSLPLLQEIAASLQQIDGRLARMEAIAKQIAAKRASSAKP